MPGTFSPSGRVNDPDMHHGTRVTHEPWCMPGSLTGGFHWSRWRGKRSRHSRRMRTPQFYVSGKRPMVDAYGASITCGFSKSRDLGGYFNDVIWQPKRYEIMNRHSNLEEDMSNLIVITAPADGQKLLGLRWAENPYLKLNHSMSWTNWNIKVTHFSVERKMFRTCYGLIVALAACIAQAIRIIHLYHIPN